MIPGISPQQKLDNLRKAWEYAQPVFVTEYPVWESTQVSEFARHTLQTDDFWKCDIYQIYSVGTSRAGVTPNQITLYQDDILVGFRSSDTAGITTDFDSNPNHKVRFTIEHRGLDGKTRTPVYKQDLSGGDAESGIRYSSFYPDQPGTYRITFNRILESGGCAIPEPAPLNFWSYEVEVVPPTDPNSVPWGIDQSEIDSLWEQYQNQPEAEPETDYSAAYLFGVGTVVSLIVFAIFGR